MQRTRGRRRARSGSRLLFALCGFCPSALLATIISSVDCSTRWKPIALVAAALVGAVPASAWEIHPHERVHPPVDPSLREDVPVRSVAPHSLRFEEFAPADAAIQLALPAQIAFDGGLEIISEVYADRLSYRPLGSLEEWATSPLFVNGPHGTVHSPTAGLFYCADTYNHRLLSFPDVGVDDWASASVIAGVSLNRPHDVLYDAAADLVYALNPLDPVVLRFRGFGVGEDALDLSAAAGGYSRALSLVNGTLYLAASVRGKVVEVHDFATGTVTVHESYGKIVKASAGSWETTGFIPNDVELYDGWWYLSNFFHPWYASGTDHNRFKLVRFRTWDDLATGNWEELSHFLPDAQVPYFFTLRGEHLFLTTFNDYNTGDFVYRITSGLFFDDFESGDLGGWAQ